MAEILTESFCERCGTRYTFESPARRTNPLGALGTVGRGLRNFVASPDQTIDEAFAVARAESEQKATAHQLEAFHQTFNFCLSCRQYTCGNCWNPVEGRCQSCAPMPEAEMLPAAQVGSDAPVVFEAMAIARAAAVPVIELPASIDDEASEAVGTPDAIETSEAVETEDAGDALSLEQLVADDLDVALPEFSVEPFAEAAPVAEPEAEAVAEPEPEPAYDLEPQAEAEAEPEPEMAESEPEVAAAESEPAAEPEAAPRRGGSSLPDFPPGVSLDDEIAAYDLRVASLAVPPVMPAPPVAQPPAAMPIAATVEPIATSQPEPPAAKSQALPPIFVAGAVPDLPAASPAALPIAQTTGTCSSCGLSVSASARFCRRCGTPQHPA